MHHSSNSYLNLQFLIVPIICIYLLFNVFSTTKCFSQEVLLRIIQPPPGQLNAADIWRFTLINTTNRNFNVYLKGRATEINKSELIVSGQTIKILLKARETKNMKVSDLPKLPDITYHTQNSIYKTTLETQGKFPPGEYEICISVFDADTVRELDSDCYEQGVQETGLLSLISPSDEEEIDLKAPIIFSWTPVNMTRDYKLKLVEMQKGQSPVDAVKNNKVFFERSGLTTNIFRYPATEKKFDSSKTYAWKVTVTGASGAVVESEVWSFKFKKSKVEKDPEKNIPVTTILKPYYELSEEPTNEIVTLTNDTLNLQFINNYVSTEKVTFGIFDDSKMIIVKDSVSRLNNKFMNGLNRISILTKKFRLKPDYLYTIIVYCVKKNLYLNFKIK